ncbi:uncharacterized protein si:dkeyp-55f12.3 [Anoplopoma fimbria]|uniref:uncharacterized protein si:dkeyp-55f12.3 n=1 Tax=Anoplopoma fimbria TaxID=229290 RepID=UPI0023EC7B4B|nr:uncharacterized protein si:dkeyp-55f12.3 [Anoplopoma fimbria]
MTTEGNVVKMAALAVKAELRFRDGQRENISVKVENTLCSVISGIHELNENVSRLLSELVQRENTCGVCAEDEDEDSDEEDGEPQSSHLQPPAKRSKT